MKYLKKFNNHSEYETYINQDYIKPNVSKCVNNGDVHYNPWVETRAVAKFNVTDTSSPVKILNSATTSVVDIEIDGVLLSNVVSEYNFTTTGEHVVKYKLIKTTSGVNKGKYRVYYEMFKNCINMTSMVLPKSSWTDSGAFSGCTSLTSAILTNPYLSQNLFENCSNLTEVTIDTNEVPSNGGGSSIYAYTFYKCNKLTSIYVKSNLVNDFKTLWPNYASKIKAIP